MLRLYRAAITAPFTRFPIGSTLSTPLLNRFMKRLLVSLNCTFLALVLSSAVLHADDNIPRAAWRIPIGQPPANPGGHKPEISNIDDGFWQGAPVGGFGAGTFSRSYRGHYERWHVKAGVHKYEDVPANQFAVFAQPVGGEAIAQVLATDKPNNGLSAWSWSYPAGSGEYAALYPKSWFAYQSPQLPIKLTVVSKPAASSSPAVAFSSV